MSELHEQRIKLLEGRVEPEYLEGLIDESGELTESEYGTVDALNEHKEILDDKEALAAKRDHIERKLESIGSVLPTDRTEALETQLEALEQASEVTNSYLDNSPEALAGRIQQ